MTGSKVQRHPRDVRRGNVCDMPVRGAAVVPGWRSSLVFRVSPSGNRTGRKSASTISFRYSLDKDRNHA